MDAIYVKKVLNGDVNAFKYFVVQYQQLAIRTAISIVKDENDAQDIVQNSFVQAYESLANFRGDARFSSWLCRIVINNSLRFLERKKVRPIEYSTLQVDRLIEDNNALKAIRKKELEVILKRAMEQLPPKEALVIQLFYLEQLSIKEIADCTDFSKSYIKVLLHRGRKGMYGLLNPIFSQLKSES